MVIDIETFWWADKIWLQKIEIFVLTNILDTSSRIKAEQIMCLVQCHPKIWKVWLRRVNTMWIALGYSVIYYIGALKSRILTFQSMLLASLCLCLLSGSHVYLDLHCLPFIEGINPEKGCCDPQIICHQFAYNAYTTSSRLTNAGGYWGEFRVS